MKITIAERFHPFSHEIGTHFLLPHSSWEVQIFPTRLFFSDLANEKTCFFVSLDLAGPILDFTAELNLERGWIRVFGKTQKGYIRYQLAAVEDGIYLTMEKTPEKRVACRHSNQEISLARGEKVCLVQKKSECVSIQERLSLGMHKAQDWDLVQRRLDMKEIFPQWFLMAAYSPDCKLDKSIGNFTLLQTCQEKIEQRDREQILPAFQNLFLSAFQGVLVPRVWDLNYQGIIPSSDTCEGSISSLPLLKQSGKLIRSMFIQEHLGEIELLPCLPPEFHCGRMVGIKVTQGSLDIEWTKKTLRSVHIHPHTDGELVLKVPKGIRSFRLRRQKSVEVVKVDSKQRGVVALKDNGLLRLDRFEY